MCRHFFRESIFTNEGGTAGFACPLDKRNLRFLLHKFMKQYEAYENTLQ